MCVCARVCHMTTSSRAWVAGNLPRWLQYHAGGNPNRQSTPQSPVSGKRPEASCLWEWGEATPASSHLPPPRPRSRHTTPPHRLLKLKSPRWHTSGLKPFTLKMMGRDSQSHPGKKKKSPLSEDTMCALSGEPTESDLQDKTTHHYGVKHLFPLPWVKKGGSLHRRANKQHACFTCNHLPAPVRHFAALTAPVRGRGFDCQNSSRQRKTRHMIE